MGLIPGDFCPVGWAYAVEAGVLVDSGFGLLTC